MRSMISFIVPVFNNEHYISTCVKSIIESCKNESIEFEVIIVDDGSFDKSSAMIDAFLAHKNNIVIVHKANSGVSSARNIGLEVAAGDYIIFIDGDDFIDPNKMLFCIHTLLNNSDVSMLVYGITFSHYYKNRLYSEETLFPPFEGTKTSKECIENVNVLFDRNCLSSVCTRIIKRSVFYDLQLREDMFLYEDLEFSLRLLNKCERVFFVQLSPYIYRINEDHLSERIRRLDSVSSVTDKIKGDLLDLGVRDEYIILRIDSILSNKKEKNASFFELLRTYHGKAVYKYLDFRRKELRHAVAVRIKYYLHRGM